MTKPLPVILVAFCTLTACENATPSPETGKTNDTAPPGAPPGTCWAKDISPAVVETVTQQVLVKPAEIRGDGSVVQPATYKTVTRQEIVEERVETWFETPCARALMPEFVASLQRALDARGFYHGAITGQMDTRTRAAIRRFQKSQGLDSEVLSIENARKIGLIAVKRT